MPSGRTGSRPRVPRPSASISSPIQRASSSPSQWPISRTFSPSATSVHRVLPRRLLVGGDHAGGGGEDVRGRAVVLLEPDDLRRRGSPSRSAGCCRPRRRASRRSTGRRRRRSRGCGARRRAGAARGTGRRWCPGTRRRGCSGTSAGTARARRGGPGGSSSDVQQQVAEVAGVERRAAAPGTRRRARRRGGRRRSASAAGTRSGVSARFFQPSIRPASSRGGQRFSSMRCGLDDLAQQAQLVVGVEDGEVRLAARPARRGGAGCATRERVEGAEPGHALDHAADEPADAVPSSRAPPCW